jgi:hypothetical protein
MPADPETVALLKTYLAEAPKADEPGLSALGSIAEVAAWLVECDRAEGRNDVDSAELVLSAVDLDRDHLREAAMVLRRLGYVSVAEMMRRLARKAKPKPAPLRAGRARPAA